MIQIPLQQYVYQHLAQSKSAFSRLNIMMMEILNLQGKVKSKTNDLTKHNHHFPQNQCRIVV